MVEKILELIYREYYSAIFQYCRTRLNGDIHGAEDCTQEVFLALTKKLTKLISLESILPWLYKTANLEVKKYRRRHPDTVDLSEIPEPAAPQQADSPLDILDDNERKIVELYYGGADKYAPTSFEEQYAPVYVAQGYELTRCPLVIENRAILTIDGFIGENELMKMAESVQKVEK